tara:strand:+ start:894 stop:1403 length:510 start_codon:yes stop_codon:yes gene_type:complete
MNWVDYIIIGIISLSAVISLVRGFVKESLSLVIWFFAFVVSSRFYQDLASHFTAIEKPLLREGAAIVALFVTTLIIGAVANYILSQLVSKTGLSGTDRVLGICFGGLRGTLVVAAMLFGLDTFTEMNHAQWWERSILIPEFKVIIQWFFETMMQDSSFLDVKFEFLNLN